MLPLYAYSYGYKHDDNWVDDLVRKHELLS